MPWSNQGGGPWQPKNQGPWGGGPQGGNGGGSSPDLEDLLRRSRDRLKGVLPSGGGGIGGKAIAALIGLGVAAWLVFGGIYTVQPNQVGIEMVFGRFTGLTQPGINYNWPAPIGRVMKPVIGVQAIEVGMRTGGDVRRGGVTRDVPEESLMLTGDENIVDVDFTVLWAVNPRAPQDFAFNLQSPEASVKAVAESAMREVIGRSDIQPILTGARQRIETGVQELMQRTLDEYRAGVLIQQVQLQKVDPPGRVIDAFRDVQAARADQERAQNEAQTYSNRVIPEARGEASRITQRAEAEKEKLIADARGESARFIKVYEEYSKAPDVTRQRLYLETIERVYEGMDKIILDQGVNNSNGVVPYLPLNELNRRPPGQQTTQQTAPGVR